MARYQLTDPRLQTALDELAARDTADWPAPDTDALAHIQRTLAAAAAEPRPARKRKRSRTASPARRAA